VIQGSFVPAFARRLHVPLRTVEPEPWTLGVRFREEPEGLHRFVVGRSAPAKGVTLADLPCGEDVWVIFIIRNGQLIPARADTRLEPGDEVVVLADSDEVPALAEQLSGRGSVP
jgi:cell volume regulation protein A